MRRVIYPLVLLLLFGGGRLLLGLDSGNNTTSATPPASSSESESPAPAEGDNDTTPPDDGQDASEAPVTCNNRDVVTQYLMKKFDRNEFTFDVDWSKLPSGNIDGRFSSPLRSHDDIITLRDTDSPRANALREIMGESTITDGYLAVQFLNPTNYSGNWFWNGQKAEKGGVLWGLGGDVWWIYVSADGCTVDSSVSLRAVCGNIGFDSLMPWAWKDD